jgi:hypothetical protein
MSREPNLKRMSQEEIDEIKIEAYMSKETKSQKIKLQQRIWDVIDGVDNERETEAGVKLSNKDVVEVLESIMDSLSPIPFSSTDKEPER